MRRRKVRFIARKVVRMIRFVQVFIIRLDGYNNYRVTVGSALWVPVNSAPATKRFSILAFVAVFVILFGCIILIVS